MTDLACQILAEQAWAPMHCSAVVHPDTGDTFLIAAAPNTGKTLTAMDLVMNHGFNYLAEDLGFLKEGQFRGVTWTNTFRYYDSLHHSNWQKWRMAARDVFPPLELVKVKGDTSLLDLVRPSQIARCGQVKAVFLLSNSLPEGSAGYTELTEEAAYASIRNLNRYEFKYETAPAVVALEGLTGQLSVESGSNAVEAQVRSLTASVPVVAIRDQQASNFASRILQSPVCQ